MTMYFNVFYLYNESRFHSISKKFAYNGLDFSCISKRSLSKKNWRQIFFFKIFEKKNVIVLWAVQPFNPRHKMGSTKKIL